MKTEPGLRRAYRSELRALQAAATRGRILDALRELITTGAPDLSIALLARKAGVALPTVYRHFSTRRQLFEAFRLHVEGASAAPDDREVSVSRQAVASAVRDFFGRFDHPEDPMAGPGRLAMPLAWEFSREVTVPRRKRWAERIVAAHAPTAKGAVRDRLVDLLVVLVSSSVGEAFRGYLQASGARTADRVNWAIEALLAHAESTAIAPPPRRRRR